MQMSGLCTSNVNCDLERTGGRWLTWDISVCKGGCGQGSSGEVFGVAPRIPLPHMLGNEYEYIGCFFQSQEVSYNVSNATHQLCNPEQVTFTSLKLLFQFSTVGRAFVRDQRLQKRGRKRRVGNQHKGAGSGGGCGDHVPSNRDGSGGAAVAALLQPVCNIPPQTVSSPSHFFKGRRIFGFSSKTSQL